MARKKPCLILQPRREDVASNKIYLLSAGSFIRYAARSVRLLIPFACRLGLNPLWITCDPENIASRRTLELAGFELVEVVDVPANCVIFQSGHPRKCRYKLELIAR